MSAVEIEEAVSDLTNQPFDRKESAYPLLGLF